MLVDKEKEKVNEREYVIKENISNKKQYLLKIERIQSLWFPVITIIISFISLGISIFALLEAKESNDIAIMPEVRMEDDYISIFWDDNGQVVYLGKDSIDDSNIEISDFISVPGVQFTNLGTGIAKDVQYDWKYIENFGKFQELLIEDDYWVGVEAVGKGWKISTYLSNEVIESEVSKFSTASFIKVNGENYQTFPFEYLEFLGRYCYNIFPKSNELDYSRFFTSDDLPKIEIIYYNSMGKKMKKNMYINFTPINYEFVENGISKCMFKITTEEERKM